MNNERGDYFLEEVVDIEIIFRYILYFQFRRICFMLKKRAESKKKKSSANNSKNQKPLLINHTDKILLKLSGGISSPVFMGSTLP